MFSKSAQLLNRSSILFGIGLFYGFLVARLVYCLKINRLAYLHQFFKGIYFLSPLMVIAISFFILLHVFLFSFIKTNSITPNRMESTTNITSAISTFLFFNQTTPFKIVEGHIHVSILEQAVFSFLSHPCLL